MGKYATIFPENACQFTDNNKKIRSMETHNYLLLKKHSIKKLQDYGDVDSEMLISV